MGTVTIPAPSTRLEVRCDAIIARNDLSKSLSDPPTLDELEAKFGRISLDRVLEPIDADGKASGPQQRIDRADLTYIEVAERTYTRPDGSTFSGHQHCWDTQIVADAHKAKGLTPTEGITP